MFKYLLISTTTQSVVCHITLLPRLHYISLNDKFVGFYWVLLCCCPFLMMMMMMMMKVLNNEYKFSWSSSSTFHEKQFEWGIKQCPTKKQKVPGCKDAPILVVKMLHYQWEIDRKLASLQNDVWLPKSETDHNVSKFWDELFFTVNFTWKMEHPQMHPSIYT